MYSAQLFLLEKQIYFSISFLIRFFHMNKLYPEGKTSVGLNVFRMHWIANSNLPKQSFALLFVCVLFVLFFLFVVVVSGEPRQKQGRGLVDHKLVQAPQ